MSPAPPGPMLALIALLGCALRLTGLSTHSFWYDEVQAIWAAESEDLWAVLRDDRHPPLFFLFLRGWVRLVGHGDAALRALPALCSCGSLWLFSRVVRNLLPSGAQLAAVAVFAVTPFQIWYGQELRMYAQLELGALLAMVGATAVAAPPRGRAALMFLGTALGLGSHYFGFLIPVLVAALLAPQWRIGPRRVLTLVAASAAGALIWLPWVLTMVPSQLATPWGFQDRIGVREVLELPVRQFVVAGAAMPVWLPWLLSAMVGLGLCGALRASVHKKAPARSLLLGLLLPLAVLAATLLIAPNYRPYYLIALSPIFAMVVAFGTGQLMPHQMLTWLFAALLLCGTVALRQENAKEDYRGAVAELASQWQPGDSIVAVTGTPEGPSQAGLHHYLRDRPELLASIRDLPALLDQLESGERLSGRLQVLYRDRPYAEPQLRRLRSLAREVRAGSPRLRLQHFTFVAGRRGG
jgi:mannosyltransferase